jgi:DNA-binding NtrC family response regulator
MIMPGMGGKEVFEELRSLDPRVEVLLAGGYSLEPGAPYIIDRGCLGFLKKPFDMKFLSEKVEEVLNP